MRSAVETNPPACSRQFLRVTPPKYSLNSQRRNFALSFIKVYSLKKQISLPWHSRLRKLSLFVSSFFTCKMDKNTHPPNPTGERSRNKMFSERLPLLLLKLKNKWQRIHGSCYDDGTEYKLYREPVNAFFSQIKFY